MGLTGFTKVQGMGGTIDFWTPADPARAVDSCWESLCAFCRFLGGCIGSASSQDRRGG